LPNPAATATAKKRVLLPLEERLQMMNALLLTLGVTSEVALVLGTTCAGRNTRERKKKKPKARATTPSEHGEVEARCGCGHDGGRRGKACQKTWTGCRQWARARRRGTCGQS